jgi:predicted histone-like DNA-binding protein
MAIKVNARETELKIGKNPGYYYVMTPDLYIALKTSKVIREAALRSGVSQGVMQACWDAAGEVIKAWATEGHSVAIPGLGTMRFALRSKAVADVNDVKTGLIKSRRIVFTPSVDLKNELANTAIQITCYDRNGNLVKRVTSDAGEVEDEENEGGNENGDTNQNQNDNGGGQNGGGTNNGGDNGGNSGGDNGGGDGDGGMDQN